MYLPKYIICLLLFTHSVDFALEVKNRTNLTTIHSLSLYFIILVGIIALVLHNIV